MNVSRVPLVIIIIIIIIMIIIIMIMIIILKSEAVIDYYYLKWVCIKWRRINSFKVGSTTIPFIVQKLINGIQCTLVCHTPFYSIQEKSTYLYAVDPF